MERHSGLPDTQKPHIIVEHKSYVRMGCKTEQLFTSLEVLFTRPPAGSEGSLWSPPSSRICPQCSCLGWTPIAG